MCYPYLNYLWNREKFHRRTCVSYTSLPPDISLFKLPRSKIDDRSIKNNHFRRPFVRNLALNRLTKSSRQPAFNMQAISVIGNGVSILFLAIIAFSSLSWQNPAKVRTALVHFTEPGDELSISLEIQLVLPLSEQVADQTPLIPSTFENDSNLSLELHSIATILLNLNLASRSGLAKPSVRLIYPLCSDESPNWYLENFFIYK